MIQQLIDLVTQLFQSTRPARGATLGNSPKNLDRRVSIHAPRTGRDASWLTSLVCLLRFNPRAPHGARRDGLARLQRTCRVSIHAPRTGRDMRMRLFDRQQLGFQSTRPARGATSKNNIPRLVAHSFNPRAPHGARRLDHPHRRHEDAVSIHAPRTGRDPLRWRAQRRPRRFNPRAPHGARRHGGLGALGRGRVSIHAPRTGRDSMTAGRFSATRSFQSTRPARGATRLSNIV